MVMTYPPRPMTVREAVEAGIIEDGSWGYGDRCPNCERSDRFAISDDGTSRCVWCGFTVDPDDTEPDR